MFASLDHVCIHPSITVRTRTPGSLRLQWRRRYIMKRQLSIHACYLSAFLQSCFQRGLRTEVVMLFSMEMVRRDREVSLLECVSPA